MFWAQLGSHDVFNTKVYQLADEDYHTALSNYNELRRDFEFDPSDRYYFLEKVLLNKDLKHYKKIVKVLIRNYGFEYNQFDTLNAGRIDLVKDLIVKEGMAKWTLKQSKRLHPKWVRKHADATYYYDEMARIHTRDQLIRRSTSFLWKGLMDYPETIDSVTRSNLMDQQIELADKIDLENIIRIQNLCVRNAFRLPSDFDTAWGCSGLITFVLFHNFKEKKNGGEAFERLYPYIEVAFLEGRINSYSLELYDNFLFEQEGIQYYGTRGKEVNFKDTGELDDRVLRIRNYLLNDGM